MCAFWLRSSAPALSSGSSASAGNVDLEAATSSTVKSQEIVKHDDEEQEEEEVVPLIPTAMTKTCSEAGVLVKAEHQVDHNNKYVFYDHRAMLSWRVAFSFRSSVFLVDAVLGMLLGMIIIATVTATSVIMFVPHARKFSTGLFDIFATFLKFFISFMLGVYIQQAFSQWWAMVTQFGKYLISIRQLIFFLHAVKVDEAMFDVTQRLAIAASYVLNSEVVEIQNLSDKEGSERLEHTLNWLGDEELLEADEIEELRRIKERQRTRPRGTHTLALTSMTWALIGDLMAGTQLQSGKKLPAAMYARLLGLCEEPVTHVEEMKTVLTAQVPYMYCHLLSCLVYLNNMFLAISCGLTIGSSISELMSRVPDNMDLSEGEVHKAAQQLVIRIMVLLCEPMLYMAFLQIGHSLCYPFGEHKFDLPTETLIAQLHVDLNVLRKGREWSRKKWHS